MSLTLTFLGAAGTVTGSKFLLENGNTRILVDCGLFQGFKALRLRNWNKLPIDPRVLDAVLLTHAHIDHSGYIPLLHKNGYRGTIHCSNGTAELCKVLLPDAGHLQEQDASFANRHGFSKHKPALPLYTVEDGERCLGLLKPHPFDQWISLPGGAMAMLRRAGHILGAASVEILWNGERIVFSGDLGRYDDAIMRDPAPVPEADYLVLESTYGDRRHPDENSADTVADIVNRTCGKGGTVVIPAFAVGRAQSLLHLFRELKERKRISQNIPIYLDSPMAIDASEIFFRHPEDHRLSHDDCHKLARIATYVRTADASRALTADPSPKIIISASGMATGGRVLHHLKEYVGDARNAVLLTGFQAGGTRGAALLAGVDAIKIHGSYYPVRAEIKNLETLSAHADRDELLRWTESFRKPPKTVFVVHGEPAAADALRQTLEEKRGWNCVVPDYQDRIALS